MALVRRRVRAHFLIASLCISSLSLCFWIAFCICATDLSEGVDICLRTACERYLFADSKNRNFGIYFPEKIQLLLKEFPTGRGVFFLSPLQSSKLELLVEPISDEERRRRRRRKRRKSKSAFSSFAKFLW
jgi:hypothetical protein